MTKNKSSVFQDFVAPIAILVAICLVMSAALAFTNSITAPIIEETELATAEAARIAILPEADAFELLEVDGLPECITAVYRATNGAGYVFMITHNGYGGKNTLSMICGMTADGIIVGTDVLSHSETAGIGTKVLDESFSGQFVGKDAALEGVDTITGATISSSNYLDAIENCFVAYDLVKEAGE